MHVIHEPSINNGLYLHVALHESLVSHWFRAFDQCVEGRRFDSCWGPRLFSLSHACGMMNSITKDL